MIATRQYRKLKRYACRQLRKSVEPYTTELRTAKRALTVCRRRLSSPGFRAKREEHARDLALQATYDAAGLLGILIDDQA